MSDDAKPGEVKLPSGATLMVTVGTLAECKNLMQAVAEEAKALRLDPLAQIDVNFWKDLFATGVGSRKIEQALQPCMKRAHYKGARIDDSTFEAVENREDYYPACYEVARANIAPFAKGLSAQYSGIQQKVLAALA